MLEAVLAVLIAFFLLWVTPHINPIAVAVTHATARIQSSLAGGFYPGAHRDDIAVMVIDDDSLDRLGKSPWPVPYEDHADWLKRIYTFRPRAIFIDVTFTEARRDETLNQLVRQICYLRDHNIPVFLAALVGSDQKLHVRKELEESDCFRMVDVRFRPDDLDRLAWTYFLNRADKKKSDHGEQETAEKPAADTSASLRSPALAMATDVGRMEIAGSDIPMALTWGVDNREKRRYASWCRQSVGGFQELRKALHLDRFPWEDTEQTGEEIAKEQEEKAGAEHQEESVPICPYSNSFTLSDLFDEKALSAPNPAVPKLIVGRYLLLGTTQPNDMVVSPVHGPIPGVFLHAMALDNLLSYHGRFKRHLEWHKLPLDRELVVLGIITVLLVHLAHKYLKWGYISRWLRRHKPEAGSLLRHMAAGLLHLARRTPARFRVPVWAVRGWARRFAPLPAALPVGVLQGGANLLALVVFIGGKFLHMALTLAFTMLFVALVQHYSSIGTLPIVDLAVLALAAEWLGWTRRVIDILFARRPSTRSAEAE